MLVMSGWGGAVAWRRPQCSTFESGGVDKTDNRQYWQVLGSASRRSELGRIWFGRLHPSAGRIKHMNFICIWVKFIFSKIHINRPHKQNCLVEPIYMNFGKYEFRQNSYKIHIFDSALVGHLSGSRPSANCGSPAGTISCRLGSFGRPPPPPHTQETRGVDMFPATPSLATHLRSATSSMQCACMLARAHTCIY